MHVEIAYATATQQVIVPLKLEECITVYSAILISEIDKQFDDLDISDAQKLCVGIFGKKIDINSYILQDGDRIEIYRPLHKTPNQKRLERAKKQ